MLQKSDVDTWMIYIPL